MTISKYIKAPKKSKKPESPEPRSKEAITADYALTVQAAGELQYKRLNIEHNLSLTNQRLSQLHAEANARDALDAASKPDAEAEV